MEPRDIENPIAEEDFRIQLRKEKMKNTKITVELIKDPARPGWKLSVEDKYAECLTYDEMLGLFVAVSMPDPSKGLVNLLRTAQEHGVYDEAFKQSIMGKTDEQSDPANLDFLMF